MPKGQSAFAQLQTKLEPAPAVAVPKVSTFEDFLLTQARVRLQGVHSSGTYGPYTFDGRPALREVVRLIDHVLGTKTGKPLKDAKCGLAGGAQFGKTTLELNLAAFVSSCLFRNPIVFLPDDGLAADIVDAKFRPDVVDQIPYFAKMTSIGRSLNESGKAVNTKGAFVVTDGKRSAVGMFRGLQKPPTSFTADVVVEDEKDDIKGANAKFVSGRMTASALRFHLEIGTQRIHGAGQNRVWTRGSQGVVLLAPVSVWKDATDEQLGIKMEHGHRWVDRVPTGFLNPEEAWPQICRMAIHGEPRTTDPVLGYEGDFRDPVSKEVIATHTPGAHYYYADPVTGEPLEMERVVWQHRVPEKLKARQYTFRVAQIGTAAIDLSQIVAHWTRAVSDAEEMVVFCCDRLAMPKSAAQAITPEILDRSRTFGNFLMGDRRAGASRFGGLDMGDRCWYVARESVNAADKRMINAQQIAIGDVVSKVIRLFRSDGLNTLFIDERPAVSEARTLALVLNELSLLTAWPKVDWRSRDTYVSLPGGLTWDGRNQKWVNLRCAVVRFTKNQLGAGIEQGAVEFEENGIHKFVPVIACNRFETIDRVVREMLTPAENVIEVVTGADGHRVIRQEPAMRLPRRVPGSPAILEVLDQHLLAGSQRVKDDKSGELGDYIDGVDNHFMFANGYSGLAETIGGAAKAPPLAIARIARESRYGGGPLV